jgi:methylglyoxal synthase
LPPECWAWPTNFASSSPAKILRLDEQLLFLIASRLSRDHQRGDNMAPRFKKLPARKRIALIAHDHRKADLLDWTRAHRDELTCHDLYATGTTGRILAESLGLEVTRFLSGPLGGDQQIGASIAEGRIDLMVFFWDPLQPQPHDPDVKALLRVAALANIPTATNRATADFLLSSPLMSREYERHVLVDEDGDALAEQVRTG